MFFEGERGPDQAQKQLEPVYRAAEGRGGELSQAVPEQEIGDDPAGLERFRDGVVEHEQNRVGVPRSYQGVATSVAAAIHLVGEVNTQERRGSFGKLVHA